MTPEAQQIAIAEACGENGFFLLLKRGFYYRPGARGYTDNIDEAGRFTEAEARGYSNTSYGAVTMQPAPLPNYPGDLNAMHKAEKVLTTDDQIRAYCDRLPLGHSGHPWYQIHATAAQRAEAFLRAIGKWEDSQ